MMTDFTGTTFWSITSTGVEHTGLAIGIKADQSTGLRLVDPYGPTLPRLARIGCTL